MTKDGFYIENCSDDGDHPFPLVGYFLRCYGCNKKILVQISLFGTNHNASVQVACAECVNLNESFVKKFPEASKDIEEFKNEI